MAEEVQQTSIQARIAALNLGHVGRAPITANGRASTSSSTRPSLEGRHQSSSAVEGNGSGVANIGNEPNGPRRNGVLPAPSNVVRTGQNPQGDSTSKRAAPTPPPRLPARKQATQASPALPPRRPSDQLPRKASNESVSSAISSTSTLPSSVINPLHSRTPSIDAGSRVKAPAYDPTTLPPLPSKRAKEGQEKAQYELDKERRIPSNRTNGSIRTTPAPARSPNISAANTGATSPPSMPALPPRRPSKPEATLPTRKLPPPSDQAPPPKPARSALSIGFGNKSNTHNDNNEDEARPAPSEPETKPAGPPPVPLSSRPDLSKLQATKPKPQSAPFTNGTASSASSSSCLLCRDFSAPDTHAAKFPRHTVPSLDWLANQLTAPFAHSPTDQARCIFTWLHHNIAYDTVSFFNNNVQPSTPASTLSTGLAVCEGYAGLFTALATKAGLESIVVGGHGKGYSFAPLAPGSPIPKEYSTHAWNAVKIDGGEWKLIDACWGAGHVNGKNQPYTKHFSPRMFTMPNDEFGLRHFPTNRNHFFRSDGTQVSWEEYIIGEGGGEPRLQIYSGVVEREGVSERSIQPAELKLPINASPASHSPVIRFSFTLICPHYIPNIHGPDKGKPYVFILAAHGLDGREDDFLPFETDGRIWWLDVERRKLGCPGQKVSCFVVESIDGQSGRGWSVAEWKRAKGRKGMGFGGVCCWELI